MADTAQFIETRSEALPEKVGVDLQLWLSKPEQGTLVKVIQSSIKQHLAKATNAALQASGDAPLKVNLADENLRTARRYMDFLDILQEIKDHKGPFEVIKWT